MFNGAFKGLKLDFIFKRKTFKTFGAFREKYKKTQKEAFRENLVKSLKKSGNSCRKA